MTKFGTLRSQFTKCSVHNGKILSMQREDFHALKKYFIFAQRKLNKGGFSPSNRGKKNLRGSISALLFIRYLWALFILESVYIKNWYHVAICNVVSVSVYFSSSGCSLVLRIRNTYRQVWMKSGADLLVLAMNFVRYGQLFATFGATSSQYATTISSLHALTETMLVVSFSVVGLECSFHFCYAVFLFWYTYQLSGKGQHFTIDTDLTASLSMRHLLTSGCKGRKTFVNEQTIILVFCYLRMKWCM